MLHSPNVQLMKTSLFALFLCLLCLNACSDSSENDAVISGRLDSIILDNFYWQKTIKEYDRTIDPDQSELRRRYFSNFATSGSIYPELVSIRQYFDLDNESMVGIRKLLEERSVLCGPFYRCDVMTEEALQELIAVEGKILAWLRKIRREI